MLHNNTGDDMNENIELLNYIYKSSEIGVVSLTNVLKELEDKENKIKKDLSDELSIYEDYKKKSKMLLKKKKANINKNSMMLKMMNKMGVKKEVTSDNSDASIAHMIIEGLTMGIVDMETKINNYKEVVDEDILEIASNYLEFQQNELEKMKKYL